MDVSIYFSKICSNMCSFIRKGSLWVDTKSFLYLCNMSLATSHEKLLLMCAATQSDKCLHCPLEEVLELQRSLECDQQRLMLFRCAGWLSSDSSFSSYTFFYILEWARWCACLPRCLDFKSHLFLHHQLNIYFLGWYSPPHHMVPVRNPILGHLNCMLFPEYRCSPHPSWSG